MRRRIPLALAATTSLAVACNREVPAPNIDETVKARLAKEPTLGSADVHVRSDGSHVFLTGHVAPPHSGPSPARSPTTSTACSR